MFSLGAPRKVPFVSPCGKKREQLRKLRRFAPHFVPTREVHGQFRNAHIVHIGECSDRTSDGSMRCLRDVLWKALGPMGRSTTAGCSDHRRAEA